MIVLFVFGWVLTYAMAFVIVVAVLFVLAPVWIISQIVIWILSRRLERMYYEHPGLQERVEYWNTHPEAYRRYKKARRRARRDGQTPTVQTSLDQHFPAQSRVAVHTSPEHQGGRHRK